MKIRIELEIPGEHDLSSILDEAQSFAIQLASDWCEDTAECKDCDGTGTNDDLDDVYPGNCLECDGDGKICVDYESAGDANDRIVESVSVEEIRSPAAPPCDRCGLPHSFEEHNALARTRDVG